MDWEPKHDYTTNLRSTSIMLFVALFVGGLFNADVFKTWAERKDVGKVRDALVTATDLYHDFAAGLGLTELPLPFFSYGGSSLLTVCAAMGLLVSIDRENRGLIRNAGTLKHSNA